IRQQVLNFAEPVDQQELSAIANRLNSAFSGLGPAEIRGLLRLPEGRQDGRPALPTEIENAVLGVAVDLMEQEAFALGEVFRDGLREVLSPPQFARSQRLLDLVDVLEQRTLASAIPSRELSEGINVVIGSENALDAMRDCSIVLARYGGPTGPSGFVGVLGPTRMRYARTI